MNITETFHAPGRAAWRRWLFEHHDKKTEIWLVTDKEQPNVSYLEAVEEAICFGWIDGFGKRLTPTRLVKRYTPRRKRSHWTELNKIRARRLIDEGKMTEAGRATLPDLSLEDDYIAADVLSALQADPETWAHFEAFSETYKRVRISYIEEMRRKPDVFQARLEKFLKNTSQNKQFGGVTD